MKLVSIKASANRTLGSASGQIQYAKDWDSPMTDAELDAFLGDSLNLPLPLPRSSVGKDSTNP